MLYDIGSLLKIPWQVLEMNFALCVFCISFLHLLSGHQKFPYFCYEQNNFYLECIMKTENNSYWINYLCNIFSFAGRKTLNTSATLLIIFRESQVLIQTLFSSDLYLLAFSGYYLLRKQYRTMLQRK